MFFDCFYISSTGCLEFKQHTVQWNLKTIKVFKKETYCLMSESLVSLIGRFNRIMIQDTQLKHQRMAINKMLGYSKVAFYESKSGVPSNLRQLEQFANDK